MTGACPLCLWESFPAIPAGPGPYSYRSPSGLTDQRKGDAVHMTQILLWLLKQAGMPAALLWLLSKIFG